MLYRLCCLAKFTKCLYLGNISKFERRKKIHVRLKPENTRVACHDALDKNEARGSKKGSSPVDFTANMGVGGGVSPLRLSSFLFTKQEAGAVWYENAL